MLRHEDPEPPEPGAHEAYSEAWSRYRTAYPAARPEQGGPVGGPPRAGRSDCR
jgi:hypothetical protein